MKRPSKKLLISISITIILVAGFFLFSKTALGQRIDFKDLPAAIKEAIISIFGLGTDPEAEIQLLLINAKSYRPGVNNIGDIVGIFDGAHEFSPAEETGFDIIRLKGISQEQAQAALAKLRPYSGKVPEEQREKLYTRPKYEYRVIDKNQTDLDKMAETNVKQK